VRATRARGRRFEAAGAAALAVSAATACLLACGERSAPKPPAARGSPNVLFIAIDDLVAGVGSEGDDARGQRPTISAPNVDRLASRGVRFTHAYAAAPQCNPSRVAVLSGLQPSRSGVYGNEYDARALLDPAHKMLPQKFAENGYFVAGCGKIYHYGRDDERGWDALCEIGGQDPKPDADDPDTVDAPLGGGPLDVDAASLRDMGAAAWAAEQLGRTHERPFFLAIGFEKPHLPWNVPREYYEENPLDEIALPAVRMDDLDDVPPIGRLLAIPGIGFEAPPGGDDALIRKRGLERRVRRGYVAATRFMDTALGRVLDALAASPHAETTIVVLWSDNGFHFGEKRHWRKATLWEESTRILLAVAGPGVSRPGTRFDGVVGLVDLYPTLVELSGLPAEEDLDGTSFAAALRSPDEAWDRTAVSTFGPGNHAVRTQRWRYIRYADGTEELYDHDADPMEWTNLAGDPAHDELKRELARRLPHRDAPDPVRDSEFAGIERLAERVNSTTAPGRRP
jgi:arylsulfatase A-like enzyme